MPLKPLKDRKAVILANHGILAGAKDLLNAFNIIEEIEYCSEVYTKAKAIGEPVILPKEEMELMAEKFKTYGQRVSTKKDIRGRFYGSFIINEKYQKNLSPELQHLRMPSWNYRRAKLWP